MKKIERRVYADPEIRDKLARLSADTVSTHTMTSAEADALLARVVWSRLVEPGDAVAGALIDALGAGPLLDHLVSGSDPAHLAEEAQSAGGSAPTVGQIAEGVKRWLPRLDRAESLADIDRALAAKVCIVIPESSLWPSGLLDLGAHAPVMLWVRGNASILSSFSLAVVGARACTGYGTRVTADLAGDACLAGVTIVSGAAYGIDAVAHRAALAADAPTVAVLAGGVDRPYPAAHGQLLDRIADVGAVCSEMVPGSAPTKWRFLQRNRNISALAQATLVTEAGTRSGSLNTAGHCADIGRALGAVPGPVTSAASAGCHRLIRDYGASLITNGSDLRELIGLADGPLTLFTDASGEQQTREPELHRRVMDALPLRGTRAAHEVARLAGLSIDETRGVLAELDLLSRVTRRETPGDSEHQWALHTRQ